MTWNGTTGTRCHCSIEADRTHKHIERQNEVGMDNKHAKNNQRAPRALLITEWPRVKRSTKNMLRKLGVDVAEKRHGPEAFDVVIMEVWGGEEEAAGARIADLRNKAGRRKPVLLLERGARFNIVRLALCLGEIESIECQSYPCNEEILDQKLQSLLPDYSGPWT